MTKAGKKIIEGLKEAATAAGCAHEFEYVRDHPFGNGIVDRCIKDCKCRFTAWPGTAHYDEIVAARDRQRQG
jgi:hypothetical protein